MRSQAVITLYVYVYSYINMLFVWAAIEGFLFMKYFSITLNCICCFQRNGFPMHSNFWGSDSLRNNEGFNIYSILNLYLLSDPSFTQLHFSFCLHTFLPKKQKNFIKVNLVLFGPGD